jgi:2-hydroxychromene-2-carboxylate isomerase
MTLSVELYWSFRSPYSYVVLPRILDLTRRYRVDIELRIVHPAAIRNPSYFAQMNKLARPSFLKDSARAASFQGLAFRRPIPDPIDQDPVTLEVAPNQDRAVRLGRLGIAAVNRGKGLAFSTKVSTLLWNGKVDNWHLGQHLNDAAARAGLDLAEMDAEIERDPASLDAQLAANVTSLNAAGHWGVPTMVFEGEPFLGQDRFDMLVWQLGQRGLEER